MGRLGYFGDGRGVGSRGLELHPIKESKRDGDPSKGRAIILVLRLANGIGNWKDKNQLCVGAGWLLGDGDVDHSPHHRLYQTALIVSWSASGSAYITKSSILFPFFHNSSPSRPDWIYTVSTDFPLPTFNHCGVSFPFSALINSTSRSFAGVSNIVRVIILFSLFTCWFRLKSRTKSFRETILRSEIKYGNKLNNSY